ncbi:WhiB family transcriptional regulator [Kitasatospora sp. NPDC059827]|uniref:WhiB family transcriptional regulator n=1 Tax=Kitasatospora sp. NPDC059827 TaxID=3346964 RepID=UPI00366893BE
MTDIVADRLHGPPCTGVPLQIFFPSQESENALRPTPDERRALSCCARCRPHVRAVCLERQMAHGITGQNGIAGGTTSAQRRELIRLRTQDSVQVGRLVRAIERQLGYLPGLVHG